MIKSVIAAIAIGIVSVVPVASAFAAEKAEVSTGRFSNLAVSGYDVVSYFVEEQPVVGSSQFETEYKGVTWRFASRANLDAFLAAPDQYTPQYGGYCAWAVSQGYTAPGNAKFWRVVDGKLYLNFNAKVQSDWNKDVPGFIEQADNNWPGVLN